MAEVIATGLAAGILSAAAFFLLEIVIMKLKATLIAMTLLGALLALLAVAVYAPEALHGGCINSITQANICKQN